MMQVDDLFKIVIGDTWQSTPGDPSAERVVENPNTVDFGAIQDVVDIRVGDVSLFGRTDENSIFYLIRDLLFGVEKLVETSGSARVSFYDGPWEIVLQRLGANAYITLYRGGQRPEILVKDRAVPFLALLNGVHESAKELLSGARSSTQRLRTIRLLLASRVR